MPTMFIFVIHELHDAHVVDCLQVLRQALNMIALRVGSTQFRTQCDVVEFHR